jgi:amino acid transporter
MDRIDALISSKKCLIKLMVFSYMRKLISNYLTCLYFLFRKKGTDQAAINSAIYYYMLHWVLIFSILLIMMLHFFPHFKEMQKTRNYKNYFELFKLVVGVILFFTYLHFNRKIQKYFNLSNIGEISVSLKQRWVCYLTFPLLIGILITAIIFFKY